MIPLLVIFPFILAFILPFITYVTKKEIYIKIIFLLGIFTPWLFFFSFSNPVKEVVGGWTRFTGIEVAFGGYGYLFILAELILFSLVGIYSLDHFEHDELNKVFALFLLMHGGLLGTFISKDLFNYYIYMEITSVSGFALIGLSRVKGSKKAAFRYIIFFFISSYLFLLFIGITYMETGYLNLFLIRENLVVSLEIKVALGLAFASLILKAGIFPLYFWLPDAHSKAQTPVSALLSGIMVKASVYGMMLISSHFPMRFMKDPLMIVAFSSMIFGVLIALMQNNVKRLLAYHTVSQLGYVLLGFATLNIQGAIYHAFAHALFKSGLFLGVGTLIEAQGTKNLKKLSYNKNWALFIGILFLSLAIGGVYPFIGSYSKSMLLSSINGYWLHLFYFVNIGTLVSFTKLNYYLFKGNRKSKVKLKSVLITLTSGILTLGFGIYLNPKFKVYEIPIIGFSILIFFILKHMNLFSLRTPNPIKNKAKGIGEENNFYSIIFVIFLILLLLQSF